MGKIIEADFLAKELEWGISGTNPVFLSLAHSTMAQILNLNVKTVLDYGAGVGAYAWGAHQLGFDVYAYDIWQSHRDYMAKVFPELKQVDQPIETDIMIMIEVAEHMTDDEVKDLFETVRPKYLLFSACNTTTELDEYWGHVNIKQPDEWHVFLEQFGYKVFQQLPLPTDHTFLYEL